MQAIANAIGFVLCKIVAALSWIGGLFVKAFESLWLMLQDFGCCIFESILKLVTVILSAFDFSGLTAYAGTWAGLPAGTLEVLSAIGISQAIGIVITALGVRMPLQLIPFVRLGS